MISEQFNIRVSPATKAKIIRNARLMQKRPAEYVRALLEKDEELETCAALDSRLTRMFRQRKAIAR